MPGSMRRMLGVLDSILILVGAIFLALGIMDGFVWVLSAGIGTPSSNPTFLLDQRMEDKLASQVAIWIPAGALLVLGGVALWGFLDLGAKMRVEGRPPGRATRIAPAVLLAGLAFLVASAAVNAVPLPQRDLVFAEPDFPMGVMDPTGTMRVSSPFTATAGEILTGTFREVYTDIMTGHQYGPIVLNSTVRAVLALDPLTFPMIVMPQSASWEFPVSSSWTFVVVVGTLDVCPPSLGCPENYTSQISGHVSVTGPAPYPLPGLLLYLPGLVLTVPPTALWRMRFGKGAVGRRR